MHPKIKTLSIINLLSLLIHISLAYATQFKLINTKDVGEVSDRFTSLFTPADFTFAIWGLIYACLLLFCIYHLIAAFRHIPVYQPNQDISRIGGLFMFNNLAAAAWLLAWTQERIGLSLGLIFFQLFTLILIHNLTGIHKTNRPLVSTVCTQFPLSIYLGWISIATIANAAAWLNSIHWDGFGYSAITWTRIMIAVAVFVALLVVLLRSNVAFGLVVCWGLYGLVSKLQTTNNGGYAELIQTAWIAIAIVGTVSVLQFIKNTGTKKLHSRFPEAIPVK